MTRLHTDPNGTWMARGACRADNTPDVFFPAGSQTPEARRQIEAAKAICDTCPVKNDCLDYALTIGEYHGIWGGTTEDERYPLLKGRRNRPPGTARKLAIDHLNAHPDGTTAEGVRAAADLTLGTSSTRLYQLLRELVEAGLATREVRPHPERDIFRPAARGVRLAGSAHDHQIDRQELAS